MTRPDCLLIKPGSQKQLYGELNAFALTAIEPPLWASLLAAYLRGLGYAVDLRDAEVEQWSHEEAARQIKEIKPVLVVISVSGSNPSASTMNMTGAGSIAKHLRSIAPEIKIMFHGLHPSALPERTLREEAADYVCEGEGFFTLPKLLTALKAANGNYRISGLWYREDGKIRSNIKAPVFADLDALPMPAWDLLPMRKYRAHNWHCFGRINERQPYGVIFTNLGCPYNCTFCCINAIFGGPGIRYRSPERVIEEIDFLVHTYGIRNFKIMDELFALKESRVIEICDLLIQRRYDLNIWAYARVNTVTPHMLAKMKKAGINWVGYGFESGSERVLKDVDKRYDLGLASSVVKMTYDAGLYIGANFIFGLPEDDFDSMQDTLDMAINLNPEWLNIYTATAYPGSELYREALEKGWPLPETWEGYSPYSYDCLPLPTRYLPPNQVLAFRDYAFHAFFENPRYLDKINRLFGMDTVRHIQSMCQHRLKRKLVQFPQIPVESHP